MRIVEDKPERMVLRDRTLWVSLVTGPLALLLVVVTIGKPAWAPGLAAAVLGLCAFVFFNSTDVVLDRLARTIDLRRMSMGRTRTWSLRFDEIAQVRVDRTSGGRNGPTFRLTFLTAGGAIPLTAAYEGGQAKYDDMLKRVRDALRSAGPSAPSTTWRATLPPPPPPAPDIVQPG